MSLLITIPLNKVSRRGQATLQVDALTDAKRITDASIYMSPVGIKEAVEAIDAAPEYYRTRYQIAALRAHLVRYL